MRRKLDICDRCHFCAHSLYLVCPVHPQGVAGEECLDFRPAADDPALAFYEPSELWEPQGARYYAGELILEPIQRLTNAQRLELLDTHPLFTGRCPSCEMPVHETQPPRVHWDCEHCGWVDDSI